MSKPPSDEKPANKHPGEGSIDQLPSGRWRVRITFERGGSRDAASSA